MLSIYHQKIPRDPVRSETSCNPGRTNVSGRCVPRASGMCPAGRHDLVLQDRVAVPRDQATPGMAAGMTAPPGMARRDQATPGMAAGTSALPGRTIIIMSINIKIIAVLNLTHRTERDRKKKSCPYQHTSTTHQARVRLAWLGLIWVGLLCKTFGCPSLG